MVVRLGPSLRNATLMKRWWIIPLVVIVLDHAAKWVIQTTLPYGTSIPITGFFNVIHVWNTGAAFSFLANQSGWQRYFFIVLAIIVSTMLAWMLRKPLPMGEAIAFSLIVGGALANALDRLVRGYVVDFLDFYWREWHWPAFNAADIAITCGAGLLIASSFLRPHSSNTPRE